jgi:hypothetical protein
MAPSACTVGYESESCDWMSMVVKQVAAHKVPSTWTETVGGWSVIL